METLIREGCLSLRCKKGSEDRNESKADRTRDPSSNQQLLPKCIKRTIYKLARVQVCRATLLIAEGGVDTTKDPKYFGSARTIVRTPVPMATRVRLVAKTAYRHEAELSGWQVAARKFRSDCV